MAAQPVDNNWNTEHSEAVLVAFQRATLFEHQDDTFVDAVAASAALHAVAGLSGWYNTPLVAVVAGYVWAWVTERLCRISARTAVVFAVVERTSRLVDPAT